MLGLRVLLGGALRGLREEGVMGGGCFHLKFSSFSVERLMCFGIMKADKPHSSQGELVRSRSVGRLLLLERPL